MGPMKTPGPPTAANANRLFNAGDFDGAAAVARAAIKKDRRNPTLHLILGSAETQLLRYREGRRALEEAARLSPKSPAPHAALSVVHHREGNLDKAHASADKALRLGPDDAFALRSKAELLRLDTRYDEARDLVASLVEKQSNPDPEIVLSYAQLSRSVGDDAAALEALAPLVANESISPHIRAAGLFIQAWAYEREGRFDDAFASATAAHDLQRIPYDPADHSRFIDNLIDVWTAERHASLPHARSHSEVPVFIVGMPRSGTSLIEQILASHPAVFAAGEFTLIPEAANRLFESARAQIDIEARFDALTTDDIERIASDALTELRRPARKAERITDKMPSNFLHLGLINLLFPSARVIHCRRNPIDTCLSCYMQDFAGQFPWTRDLESIAAFHNDYRRLMDHWRGVVDIPILDVDYESVVADQETETRRLIDFAGLEWNDACLAPHETRRTTVTLSAEQVRRPVYRSSVERWRRYEAHLQPLIDALDSAPV